MVHFFQILSPKGINAMRKTLTCAYRYILQPSSFNLMPAYLKHQTYWNYETVIIREEIPD